MHVRPSLPDCKVLVIEDEASEALDLKRPLLRLGCTVLGPVDTQAAAMDLLRRERPNVARLDLTLRDGPAVRVAERLHARRVPMAATTGCDVTLSEHALLQGVPLPRKPYGPAACGTSSPRLEALGGPVISPRRFMLQCRRNAAPQHALPRRRRW